MEPLTENELAKAMQDGQDALAEENKHKFDNRQLAVIQNVRIGWDDNAGFPGFQFDVRFSESGRSLQFVKWEDFGKLLSIYKLLNVSVLEGCHCWVYIDKDKGTVEFLDLCLMG